MYLHLTAGSTGWESRPHFSAPGTLGEQLAAVNLFGVLPKRLKRTEGDREHAWQVVRAVVMPHAREGGR